MKKPLQPVLFDQFLRVRDGGFAGAPGDDPRFCRRLLLLGLRSRTCAHIQGVTRKAVSTPGSMFRWGKPILDGDKAIDNGKKATLNGIKAIVNGKKATRDGEKATRDGEKATRDGKKATRDGKKPPAMGKSHPRWEK